jgi:hypothetical protein
MAKYNTFLLVDTKTRRPLLVTSSARKAKGELWKGRRVEVWNENAKVRTIYARQTDWMDIYIATEKEYISMKQLAAEVRNLKRGIMRM